MYYIAVLRKFIFQIIGWPKNKTEITDIWTKGLIIINYFSFFQVVVIHLVQEILKQYFSHHNFGQLKSSDFA